MQAAYYTRTPEETIELGEKLSYLLRAGDTILLFGDLGSGKTHFAKGVARGLGIKDTIKSPTFAYVNKYKQESTTLFHYDLYRLNPGDDLSSIGLEETMEDFHAINIVEWADRMVHFPKQYIYINFVIKEDIHKITIRFTDSQIVPDTEIQVFYQEWGTPLHVRDHIKQVNSVAMKLAGNYIAKKEIINLNLLYSGAMLHDVARVCDFFKLDRAYFYEEITKEKAEKWKDLRKTHKGLHHADIAKRFLNDLNYEKTAELIYSHKSAVLVEEPEKLKTLENKILYYADKRVKGDQIVPLQERFRDGRERYAKYDDQYKKELFDEVEKKTYELEKELFAEIDITPDDL